MTVDPNQPENPTESTGTDEGAEPSQAEQPAAGAESSPGTETAQSPETSQHSESSQVAEVDVSSPAKVMRIGTMVKQLLEEVHSTDLDEKGRERLAKIHRRSIDELEDGLSRDLIDELERLDLPFDSNDGPPTSSELRIAQAQLVGWLEGLFHGVQTAIMAQQAMAQQGLAGRGQLPAGMVPPGAPGAAAGSGPNSADSSESDEDNRGTGNYL